MITCLKLYVTKEPKTKIKELEAREKSVLILL